MRRINSVTKTKTIYDTINNYYIVLFNPTDTNLIHIVTLLALYRPYINGIKSVLDKNNSHLTVRYRNKWKPQ